MNDDVTTAARPNDPQRAEPRILALTAAVLLALAAVFLWNELRLPLESISVAVAVAVALLAAALARANVKLVGPLVVLSANAAVGLWYAATREPVLLAG
jgi:hypothetical protein